MNQFNPINYSERETTFPMAQSFITGVFSWMGIALGITAITSWLFASSTELMAMLLNPETGSMSMLGWIVMLAPLGLVLWMSAGFNRMSASTMLLVFVGYSILMGMSLSFIFYVYTLPSIAKTFLVTTAMFGFMALLGYTTKTDLTKFGSILLMALVGIIIATLVNYFMKSTQLDYIISFLGVMIFAGLTAYDVQKLKRIGASAIDSNESLRKMTIFGALTLYLDFINLFLFLLRFLGSRK